MPGILLNHLMVCLCWTEYLWNQFVSFSTGVPKHLNVEQIKGDLMKIDDVYSVEDLNVWSLTTGKSTAIARLQLSKYIPSTGPYYVVERNIFCNV